LELLEITFFAVVFIQVIYLLIFSVGLSRSRGQSSISQTAPPVSIIICAHDEEEHLKELLPQLLDQAYPEFEVIVVNDRSNDNTFEYLIEQGKKDPRVRMVNVDHVPAHVNSKKYALTLGIKAARNEWLLLTDADCRPSGANWISSMSSAFRENTQFVLGVSPYQKAGGFLNLFIRFESLLTALQYSAFALLNSPYMGVGRNLAYRKSFFLQEKGFNQFMSVTGGDDDLYVNQHATAANTSIILGKEAAVMTFPERSWSEFFRQKKRHLSVGRYYKFKHRFWLGLFISTWLISWVLLAAILILQTPLFYFAVGAMVIRIIVLIFSLQSGIKRFGQKFELWTVPFLDFLFSIYYLTTGLITLGAKNVRWKN
jgi:cellulose synthase/poly-beta-1,6-N-acetylglucosamine synthase-like glycosyltransferase